MKTVQVYLNRKESTADRRGPARELDNQPGPSPAGAVKG